MKNIFSIVCYLILSIIFLKGYIKDKKTYKLLTIILIAILIFLKTPFGSNINKTIENTLGVIYLILLLVFLWLVFKEIKKKDVKINK